MKIAQQKAKNMCRKTFKLRWMVEEKNLPKKASNQMCEIMDESLKREIAQ
jgi:hypothetical protein